MRVQPLKTASNALKGHRVVCPVCKTHQVERLHPTLGRELLPVGMSWGHCRQCGRDLPISTGEWLAAQKRATR